MKKNYTPYTYLIGWSKLDKWYYGSRYATKNKCLYESGCHPDDFWVTYHTSSDVVTAFREEHGEPDVMGIRKTFSNADDAVDWETKVLQRMNVVKDDKWLNQHDKRTPKSRLGITPSQEHKNKIGDANRGEKNGMYGTTVSAKEKKRLSDLWKGKPRPLEVKKKISESHLKRGGPNGVKVKVTYLQIEKTYVSILQASNDLGCAQSMLSRLLRGLSKRSIKYPGLKIEYV
tara:strand:+ start:613 stop:1302 length:690 start_codon:yes stop_codon:yes gene_type:complete